MKKSEDDLRKSHERLQAVYCSQTDCHILLIRNMENVSQYGTVDHCSRTQKTSGDMDEPPRKMTYESISCVIHCTVTRCRKILELYCNMEIDG